MNGPCKLCGNVGPLRESHVIPDFLIRGAQHQQITGSKGVSQPFTFVLSTIADEEGGAKQRGQWEKILGIKEYMLCDTCEGEFSEYESYARMFLYGKTPQPLKKIPIGCSIAETVGRADLMEMDITEARKVISDYKRLKLFQLSILWRAGMATGSFFEEVSLGNFHETKLRNLLRARNPGSESDYACTMIDLQHKGKGCEDWIEPPKRSKGQHQVSYQFIMGGYMYLFTVSKQKPKPNADVLSIKPSGEMIVIVANAQKIIRSKANDLRRLGRI